ncbi:bifunctional diguanylate cyclase/phosphodiesterase [Sphingomonas paeninsulae]|uniref:Bifunctional diguanylate cyclase/phosphodiesterase n=1 Tax=Sphingomonas paeninsulae TaxID=2319844 RepID=A0A494TA76_SPHPE|nr:bifunctional diguanylate cyclase/phosphodiesterase [Sphingomonas paeninsulae]AYJ85900.1 bifunctional diguanylate cyclase/phosphodiesterase [Sphingomonas paeninsulae]
MEGVSLKSRAVAFAACVGATAFILALLATADAAHESVGITRALVVAIICGVMSWASAERSIAGVAESVDAASVRIVAAAQGDLISPTPAAVGKTLPEISMALDSLFRQVRANLDSVHALAMFDPVTSLANRTNFRREADHILRSLSAESEAALFFLDLDNFKAVNDTYGHAQGDQLLAMVANRLRVVADAEGVRSATVDLPLVGRLAGDEFTILFPHVDGVAGATRVARGLLAVMTESFDLAGHSLDIGASIGVAMRPAAGQSLPALMRAADLAMYHAKASGRAQFQFYSDALATQLADRTRLENDLRLAVERDELTVALQPQLSLADGSIIAAEALLRWNHPVDGMRTPETFIAAAEESGIIFEVGHWSIDAVGRMAAEWAKADLPYRLAVNISPRQINRADFFPRLRKAIEHHGISLKTLEFEISEGLAMSCGEAVLSEIAKLREGGARVALDDFGSGYSSLTRLSHLPIDRVKIDGTLIADIATHVDARTIVQSIIGLAHGLGFEVVAEGVETADQMEVLRVMGCDAAQGFAIAHPMSEAEFLAWGQHDPQVIAV